MFPAKSHRVWVELRTPEGAVSWEKQESARWKIQVYFFDAILA